MLYQCHRFCPSIVLIGQLPIRVCLPTLYIYQRVVLDLLKLMLYQFLGRQNGNRQPRLEEIQHCP